MGGFGHTWVWYVIWAKRANTFQLRTLLPCYEIWTVYHVGLTWGPHSWVAVIDSLSVGIWYQNRVVLFEESLVASLAGSFSFQVYWHGGFLFITIFREWSGNPLFSWIDEPQGRCVWWAASIRFLKYCQKMEGILFNRFINHIVKHHLMSCMY